MSLGTPVYILIIQLMFAGYGQAILLFPIIWYVIKPGDVAGPLNEKWVIGSLVIGLSALWIFSIVGIVRGMLPMTHLAAIVGIIITWFGCKMAAR